MDIQHLTNIAIKAALAAGKIIKKAMREDVIVAHKRRWQYLCISSGHQSRSCLRKNDSKTPKTHL